MAEDLLDKDQHEAEKDLNAWKELELELFLAFMEIIKGLFPEMAEVKKGQGITIEKKKRGQDQNLEIQQPATPTGTEAVPTPGYTTLYGMGVNNLTPENVKAIAAIMRSEMGDTVVGGEGLIVKFNGKTLYETDETGKIITHSRISQQVRDRLEAIQPGAKSTPAQAQPANSGAIDQAMNTIADETAKDIAAKNAVKQNAKLPKSTIEEAITFLASQDDGAKKADGKGFNGDDTYFGNKMAKDIADGATIDADRAKFALDLLQKYSRQLAVGGYKLPEWEDVQDKYPSKSIVTDLSKEAAQERLAKINKPADSIELPPNFNRAASSELIKDRLELLQPSERDRLEALQHEVRSVQILPDPNLEPKTSSPTKTADDYYLIADQYTEAVARIGDGESMENVMVQNIPVISSDDIYTPAVLEGLKNIRENQQTTKPFDDPQALKYWEEASINAEAEFLSKVPAYQAFCAQCRFQDVVTDEHPQEFAESINKYYSGGLRSTLYFNPALPSEQKLVPDLPAPLISLDVPIEAQKLSAGDSVLPKRWNDIQEERSVNQEPATSPIEPGFSHEKELTLARLASDVAKLDPSDPSYEKECARLTDDMAKFESLSNSYYEKEFARLNREKDELESQLAEPESVTYDPIAEDIPTRAVALETPEPNPEVEDRSVSPVAYPGFMGASSSELPEEPTAPVIVEEPAPVTYDLITEESLEVPIFRETATPVKLPEEPTATPVVEATVSTTKPDRSGEAIVATTEPKLPTNPIALDSVIEEPVADPSETVDPEVQKPIEPDPIINQEPKSPSSASELPQPQSKNLSLKERISQSAAKVAQDAAKTVGNAIASKIKSDIATTNNALIKPMTNVVNNAVIKPVTDAVKDAQDLTNSVIKETIDDIKSIGNNSAQNLRDAITLKLPQDSPLTKGYDKLRASIGKGIIPESDQEILETINKSVDSVKDMFIDIAQGERDEEEKNLAEAAQEHRITPENKEAWQSRIVDTKKVAVAFQLFSTNTDENSLSSVKFPDGSQLSATINEDRVSTLSYTKNDQTTELGTYDQKSKSYTATDVSNVSEDLQNIAQYIEPGTWKVKDSAKEIGQPVITKLPDPAPVRVLVEKPVQRKPIEIDERSLLNPELEEQLIAQILTEPDAYQKAVEQGISANTFDFEPYRETFKAAEKLSANNQPVNLSTIDTELGGKFSEQSVNAINRMDLSVSLDYVLKAVETKEFRTNTLRAASEIRKIAYGDAPLKSAADASVQTINSIKGKNLPEPTIFSQSELIDKGSEQKVLSALISQPKFYAEAQEFGLRAESFSSPENKRIFEAASGLYDQGVEINPLSVKERLSDSEDKVYASNVVANAPMSPAVINDLKKVIDLTGRRELVAISDKLTNSAYDTSLRKQDLEDNLRLVEKEIAATVPVKAIGGSATKVKQEEAIHESGKGKMPTVSKSKAKPTATKSKKPLETTADPSKVDSEPVPVKAQKSKGGR
jgi:hypothetical protein